MEDVEARALLSSVLEVCEHEMRALESLCDARLSGVLQAMTTFRAELVAALATLTPDAINGESTRQAMSIFGFYFVSHLLSEMGWPRKEGIRKRQVYDLSIVDVAIAQSVDWGAALGAGRPRLSLQLIAEMFRDL